MAALAVGGTIPLQLARIEHAERSLCGVVDRERLEERFAADRGHLGVGETHFHIVVTSGENDWEFPRILTSPPYRDRAYADRDAKDPRFVAHFEPYDVNILECHRACPHSSLGRFGWEDEQPEPYRWWGGRG